MSTVALYLDTLGYPTITNDIKVALYKPEDPLAEVAAQQQPAPHPERQWSFLGLDRRNYLVKILEMAGTTVVRQLNSFTIVPDNNEFRYKAPQQVQFGVDDGFPAGGNTVTVPSWVGWEIIPERIGSGTLKRGVDYSYDIQTGRFTLVKDGDEFSGGEWFFFQFEPIVETGGGSVNLSGELFRSRKTITDNYNVAPADFGTKLVLKGTGTYFELQLPDIASVVENRLLFIESGVGNHKCVAIRSGAGTVFDWGTGNRSTMYICPTENMSIYKERIDATTSVWRIHDADGNFRFVGSTFFSDAASVLNAVEEDGGGVAGLDANEYARIYNDHVLNLPAVQLVPYDQWAIGSNIRKFSFKDPVTNRFRIPDRRDMVKRANASGTTPGDYEGDAVYLPQGSTTATITAKIIVKGGTANSILVLGVPTNPPVLNPDPVKGQQDVTVPLSIQTQSGVTETRVKGVRTRSFLFV